MIRLAVGIFVRALVEIGLVLFVVSGLFFFLAYRTARRFATTTPDALDKLAATLSTGLGVVANRSRRAELREYDDELGAEPIDVDYEFDDEDDRRPVRRQRVGRDEWKDLVV